MAYKPFLFKAKHSQVFQLFLILGALLSVPWYEAEPLGKAEGPREGGVGQKSGGWGFYLEAH